jgi:hypothetical protein
MAEQVPEQVPLIAAPIADYVSSSRGGQLLILNSCLLRFDYRSKDGSKTRYKCNARQVGMQGEGMLGIGNVENIPPAFSSLRSSAYRARLSTLPPVSNTADEYVIENDIIEQVMILDIHNANNGQPRFIIRKALPNEWECETAEWVR